VNFRSISEDVDLFIALRQLISDVQLVKICFAI